MATTSFSSEEMPVIGVLSLGEMGTGIASLLLAHDYKVATCTAGRSKYTLKRIQKSGITAYHTDAELVAEVDVLLSIVPPRDATATAVRILEASRDPKAIKRRNERKPNATDDKLVYIDCNAISARATRNIAAFFVPQEGSSGSSRPALKSQDSATGGPPAPPRRLSLMRFLSFQSPTEEPGEVADLPPPPIKITYLDGGIIGGPPKKADSSSTSQDADKSTSTSSSSSTPPDPPANKWTRPSLILSGPSIEHLLPAPLLSTLNTTIISPSIGAASTLKSCFAATTKGLTALLTISLATASQSSVLPHLLTHLDQYAPGIATAARGSMPSMPPKAYRWVEEMRQIGSTFATEGGLACGEEVFGGVAGLYEFVSESTVLGEERVESRKRGRTAEDVAACVAEGVRSKRRKAAEGVEGKEGAVGGEGDLKLAWRGSWS